ncbi:MAG: formylglycine-generating enzyme family protein, partial [Verrucomicrobiales bacterium]|nr:formylglycine-generating enzyme family protein [Verrucomicrobiales bacterium]
SWIPAGDAEAGGGAKLPEERARSGGIATGFWLGRTEVTQGQYREVMGSAPSRFSGSDLPVESVSWVDATEFCRRLGAREGRTYRLPTEVEWEYACRAGTRTAFGFGDDDTWLGEFAWYDASSGFETHPVGTRKPNAWGFYDMHGNVWEWCLDPYPGEGGVSSGPAGDAAGGSGSLRVRRGGAWYNRPVFCRSSRRDFDRENRRDAGTGFRIVWEVEQGGPGA